MTIGRLMIAGALVLLTAILVLRDGGQDTEPATGKPEHPVTQGQTQPRNAGESRLTPETRMRPGFDGYPADAASPHSDPYQHLRSRPLDGIGALETYRFRPLTERERQRIEQGPWDPYGSYPDRREPWQRSRPTPTGPGYRAAPTQPGRWTPEWEDRSWGTQGYSFRPVEPSGGTRQRWEGPYSAPRWPDKGYPPRPDPLQAPPQWGALPSDRATPPYRMYRSHDVPRDRRFSLR